MAALASYALILLDLGLPDTDGLKLLPGLRANGKRPRHRSDCTGPAE
jgi:DNA-binding response OmpR family regulator